MKVITQNTNFANVVMSEIHKDKFTNWYHPRGKVGGGAGPGDFDHGRMKFLNRNLNYFYIENMISLALKDNYDYNPNYKNTLGICNELRNDLDEHGPFGRMCVWKLPPKGFLLEHVDNWEYHRQITRYILCVGTQEKSDVMIKINKTPIDVVQGLLFQFHPSTELHEFVNYTDKEWYFLGFDYWNLEKLSKISKEKNIDVNTLVTYNSGFGGFKSMCKFMSKE